MKLYSKLQSRDMKKVLFLFLMFSLMLFLLSNLVAYFSSTRETSKLVLVFGVFAKTISEYIADPELIILDFHTMFVEYGGAMIGGGFYILIVNVIAQAMISRWRPYKTLITFYIPLSLIPSPLLASLWKNGYINFTSVFLSFMAFLYTSIAMIYARSTLGRHAKIKANKTGMCVVLVNKNFSQGIFCMYISY